MILPTAYLAPISWYERYLNEPTAIEIYESFEKQTFRNRCEIAGPNGRQTLTVPVQKCESKQLTRDIRISYQSKWQHIHLQALMSAYKNTPFYEYYEDFFRPIYNTHYEYLIDLNEALHDAVMRLMYRTDKLVYTTEWMSETALNDAFLLRRPINYYQIFADKTGFQQNLSIVDLLFNTGNEAITYLT